MTSDVYLGRQPIVDADRQVFGYELLFRGGPEGSSNFDDPDAATRGVMERVLLHWGMERVVGDRFGLINASATLVLHGLHRAMPPEGMIIEVRVDEVLDEETAEVLQHARWDGYHFALDNVSRLGDLDRSTLLPFASIVKIELTTAHDAEIPGLIAMARERSPGVLVVAEKVETVTDFKRSVEHGFDLFQGYYLAKPEVLHRPARPAGRSSAAAVRRSLVDDQLDLEQLEAIVARDPSLAFRLLAAVNANAFGLDRDVDSLEQAMGLLGPEKLRCVAELIATSADTIDGDTHIATGAARAQMAAALLADTEHVDRGITVALLSATDALYDTPMGQLLDELPVSDEVVAALLHGHGRLGRTIDIIRACERGDTFTLDELAPGRRDELQALHAAASGAATPADEAGRVPT
jgi:EAL and modified HD-GYP domain-containing signal transduction protein